jgi:hypothetical protein
VFGGNDSGNLLCGSAFMAILLAAMEHRSRRLLACDRLRFPVSKSQMLTTFSHCGPGCPMSFGNALITAGYNR